MEKLIEIYNWMYNHIGMIAFVLFVIWERKVLFRGLFLEPIRGGNGKTQMDELAKWIMIWLLVGMVYFEGASVEQVFPESWGWALIAGIFLIAGYEKTVHGIVEYLSRRDKDNKKPEKKVEIIDDKQEVE
jgi:hypothetical protein